MNRKLNNFISGFVPAPFFILAKFLKTNDHFFKLHILTNGANIHTIVIDMYIIPNSTKNSSS